MNMAAHSGHFTGWQLPSTADTAAADMQGVGAIAGFSFSLERGSVALRTPDGQVLEQVLEGHRNHAPDALPSLQALMTQAGLAAADVVAVAADVGPGGFTGLRTACALAQGLAIGWQVPCVAVASLSLMACAALERNPAEGVCVAALDARQAEVYAAAWQLQNGLVTPLTDPALYAYQSEVQRFRPAGGALSVCGPGLQHLDCSGAVQCEPRIVPMAGVLVRLAAQAVAQGAVLDPVQCQPLYVRHQVALTTAQRQARAQG